MKIQVKCENCNSFFEIDHIRLNYGRGKNCSRKCQYQSHKKKISKPKIKCVCIGCKKIFYRSKSQLIQKGVGKFCSLQCRKLYRFGFLHPQFRGTHEYKRGRSWQKSRRIVKKRDRGICQLCKQKGIDVHHIVPFRLFGIERCDEANNPDNLILLCKPCHRQIDAETDKIIMEFLKILKK